MQEEKRQKTMNLNRIYNQNCMDGMKEISDKYFDLAVVDPPYFSGPERRGFYGRRVSPIGVQRHYEKSENWDVPTAEYFDELIRVSKEQIVWAATILIILLGLGALSGIRSMVIAVFQIVKLPIAACMTACAYSAICGMG